MLFPSTAEYALRAMVTLGALAPSDSLTSADLSERTQVPLAYLSKVLRQLVAAGLLHGQRGHHGGFRLSRPPEQITFGEVLVAVGFHPPPNRCAMGWGTCSPAVPCPLHNAWSQIDASYQEWARCTTIASALAQGSFARANAQ